jgi:TRAP-type C4-dicarboxylate transport system permease small subunit
MAAVLVTPWLGPAIAFLVNALRVTFGTQLGRWIVSAMVFLGISYGTHKIVVTPAITALTGYVQSGGSGQFISYALAWVGVLWFDKATSMIISAVVTRAGIRAASTVLRKVGT